MNRTSLSMIALLALVLVTGAIAVGFWALTDGESDAEEPDESLNLIGIVIEDRNEVGQIQFHMSPADVGDNKMWLSTPAGAESVGIEAFTIRVMSLTFGDRSEFRDIELSDLDEQRPVELTLDDEQFLQIEVLESASDNSPLATFIVIIPDPNLHGMDRFVMGDPDSEAGVLYDRGLSSLTSLHRVRYVQPLADGLGGAVTSFRDVNDGYDGSVAGFTYFNPGGLEAVVIGAELWTRSPGEAWEVRDGNPLVPPSEWGEEYEGSTGFTMGPELALDEGSCRIVTFVAPEVERRAIAWYAWCIDEQTGHILRDGMVARNHYMITDYYDFDGDVVIEAPE